MVSSNRESGDGFSDIQIMVDESETGIIIEVKYAENDNLEAECQKALKQIREKHYTENFVNEGIHKILKYGIACNRKCCRVLVEAE